MIFLLSSLVDVPHHFRLPAQHTVQPSKGNLVAVANSGASKGGMMSSRTSGIGGRNNSSRPSAYTGTVIKVDRDVIIFL